jgi:hypothetical protein
MNPQKIYLHNMVGKVIELHFPYRAVVAFMYKGKQERALLKADKLVVYGHSVGLVCSDPYCNMLGSCSRNVIKYSFIEASSSSMHDIVCKLCNALE